MAAILTLNTVAHTIGAAGVAQVTIYGDEFLGFASAILTVLIFLFWNNSKNNWSKLLKGLSKSTFYILKAMLFITYPVVIISIKITKLFAKDNKIRSHERSYPHCQILLIVREYFQCKKIELFKILLILKN